MRSWMTWAMPRATFPAFLSKLDEKVRSSDTGPEHRETLIRLKAILEADLAQDADGLEPDIITAHHVLTCGDWDRIVKAALLNEMTEGGDAAVDEPGMCALNV